MRGQVAAALLVFLGGSSGELLGRRLPLHRIADCPPSDSCFD